MKSSAIKGMSLGKFLNPFYDTARRFLGLSPATVDEYLSQGATAALESNNVVTLTTPDGKVHTVTARSWHRGKAASWINDFNERSGK
jgi:hypothetical protein